MPRGDLFQLGLTPVQSMRSMGSYGYRVATDGPLFAPALPTTQRVSTLNMADEAGEIDILDVLDVDMDAETPYTPNPSRTTTGRWLPSLSINRHAGHNPSTTAVFESGSLIQPRRTSFMSRLVGSAWGLTGIGFTSINPHRRAQPATAAPQPLGRAISPLPSIPQGNGSIEQAVFGPSVTTSRLSAVSGGSRRYRSVSELPPANSTMRMTGSKSGRALDHLSEEAGEGLAEVHVKFEERPKKKRRSCATEPTRLLAPSPPSTRMTRSMATRQVDVAATSPTRVTRSTSKRLAELANGPAESPCDGVITPELIMKQRMASRLPYPTPPASERSASPHGSPSSQPIQPRNFKTSELSNETTCWIPTLDEVSRADPEERERIFQRLAAEAKRDEQRAASRAQGSVPGSEARDQVPGVATASKGASPHVGMGAVAFQLIRPAANPPVLECPATMPHPRDLTMPHAYNPAEPAHKFNSIDNYPHSEWRMDVPVSPTVGAWNARDSGVSEETISQWAAEDKENQRRIEEERRLRRMGVN
ncbi:hypothetical protein FRC07_008227 [Ceratobasidium sp. 392]|nr:hypothetical protein FRC07_008227 [Ceratobasidium sp. 392]